MEMWLQEFQSNNIALTCRVKDVLYNAHSEYQHILVVDTEMFGRMLVLDGVFQTSIFEEFTYHEMIVHVPLFTHPNPKRVLIIGGGDGGSVREAVKHPEVEQVEMVEIDGMVVEAAKKFLPETSEALINNHPKVKLTIGDGIKYMADAENAFDVIIVDCSDPVGPGEGLFTPEFYRNVYKALKDDGLFVQQTESPFYHQDLIKRLYRDISALFPITKLYLSNIPIYPGGLHTFTIGSKKYDPLQAPLDRELPPNLRYYNKDVHRSAFMLPNFVAELTK